MGKAVAFKGAGVFGGDEEDLAEDGVGFRGLLLLEEGPGWPCGHIDVAGVEGVELAVVGLGVFVAAEVVESVREAGLGEVVEGIDFEDLASGLFDVAQRRRPIWGSMAEAGLNDDKDDNRLELRLARHNDHRSRLQVVGDLAAYGSRVVRGSELTGDATLPEGAQTEGGSDWFWWTELNDTYRPLRTLYDFNFGVGVMRGNRAVIALDGDEVPPGVVSGEVSDSTTATGGSLWSCCPTCPPRRA